MSKIVTKLALITGIILTITFIIIAIFFYPMVVFLAAIIAVLTALVYVTMDMPQNVAVDEEEIFETGFWDEERLQVLIDYQLALRAFRDKNIEFEQSRQDCNSSKENRKIFEQRLAELSNLSVVANTAKNKLLIAIGADAYGLTVDEYRMMPPWFERNK